MARFNIYRSIKKVLVFIIIVLLVFILQGTIIAFLRVEDEPIIEEKKPYTLRGGVAIYNEIGQIRATSKDEREAATIVVHPFLEYDATNIPLQEELVKKKEVIRASISDWFSSHTWLYIEAQKEQDIKKKLMEDINSKLDMGSVLAIYFEKFTIFH